MTSSTSENQEKNPHEIFIEINEIPSLEKKNVLFPCLCHPSATYELPFTREFQDYLEKEYRRLANLGDTIYTAIVTNYLFKTYSSDDSKELTESRKDLLNKEVLLEFAEGLDIISHCYLGKSLLDTPVEKQAKLFAEIFKALIGKLHIEIGFEQTYNWLVERCLKDKVYSLYEEEEEDEFEDDEDEDHDRIYNSAGIPWAWIPGFTDQ